MSDSVVVAPASAGEQQAVSVEQRKPRKRARDARILAGLVLLVLCVPILAILAPWIAPYDPAEQNLKERLEPPSTSHPFGTDQYGRDLLSRLLWGARTTLFVSSVTILIAGSLGIFAGMYAGYKAGFLDDGVKFVVDLLMAFPTLLLGLMVLATMGPGTYNLIVAASLSLLPKFIRLGRNVTVSIKEKEYIVAAEAVGASDLRIVLRHILPNLRDNVLTFSIIWLAQVVRMEAGLSFLGVGIQPPTASWGLMIREGFNFLHASPWLALFPGICVVLYLLVLSLLSDQILVRFA